MFFLERVVFIRKKNQGCTTQKSELGMHQNLNSQLNPLKNKKHPEINPLTGGQKIIIY